MLKCYQMMNLVKRKIVSQLNYITSKPYYLTNNILLNSNGSSVNKYYSSINVDDSKGKANFITPFSNLL